MDIATLGIAIDTTDVSRGTTELDKLTAAGGRAETAANKVGAEIGRQNAAMQQSVTATQAAAQSIDRNSKAYKDLDDELAKFLTANNKAYAATRALDQANSLLKDGVKAGLVSQATATATLETMAAKYAPAAEGAAKLGAAHAASAIPVGLLTREVRALGDEFASGRYRQAEGTTALLATRLLSLGPAGLGAAAGIVGVAVAIGLVIAKQEEMARAINTIQIGFASTGSAVNLTGAQIKTYIETLARLPGVSTDAAEKTITALSRVPYITGPLFDTTTKHLGDIAAMFGSTVPVAAAKLAKAFEDPARGGAELDKQFNLLTVDQRLLFEAYIEHGDRAAALGVIMQGLEDRSAGLGAKLTPLQKSVNDVGNAWNDLMKSFGDNSGTNTAANGMANLLERVASLIKFVKDHTPDWSTFVSIAQKIPQLNLIASVGQKLTSPIAGGGNSVSGKLIVGDAAPATAAATSGQSDPDRATLDAGQKFIDRSDKAKDLIELENKLKDIYARQTAELKNATGEQATQLKLAQAHTQEEIKGVQAAVTRLQKVPGGAGPGVPLGLNVDKSALDAALKVQQVAQAAEKAALDERQKYLDFYHKAGVTTDAQYNADTDALAQQRIASLQASYAKEEALVKADQDQKRAQLAAGGKNLPLTTSDALNSGILQDEKQLVDLKGKEAALTAQIAADSKFRADTAPLVAAQTAYNEALKQTQEISSALSVITTQTNLEVQLGQKTQLDGLHAITDATQRAIDADKQQLDILTKIQAQHIYADGTVQAIALQNAIDQLNIKLLQMQANLDPIGKQFNGFIDSGLTDYLDKIGTGGVKSFKDLWTATKGFFNDLDKQILHVVDQNLADQITNALGLKANSTTGGTGGLGGALSRLLGFSGTGGAAKPATTPTGEAPLDITGPVSPDSSATGDAMGDFIKSIGAASNSVVGLAKNTGEMIIKQITGTATEVTSTTATVTATSALAAFTQALLAATAAVSGGGGSGGGGLGSLFGGGSSGGSIASAEQISQADSMAAGAADFSADGVVPFLHGGGIAGRDAAFSRSVDMRIFNNAPRFHSGGIAGYEIPAVLQKGEEVLTESDPRHRKNAGKSGRSISVVNNFNMPKGSNLNAPSREQAASQAAGALNRAMARA